MKDSLYPKVLRKARSVKGQNRIVFVSAKVSGEPAGSNWRQRFDFARRYFEYLHGVTTDAAVAKAMGMSAASFSELAGREDAPKVEHGLAAGRVLGVDPGWLLCGEASAAPAPPGWDRELDKIREAAKYPPVRKSVSVPVPRPAKKKHG